MRVTLKIGAGENDPSINIINQVGPDDRYPASGEYHLIRASWGQSFLLEEPHSTGWDPWLSSLSGCCEAHISYRGVDESFCVTCQELCNAGFEKALKDPAMVEEIAFFIPLDPLASPLVASALLDHCLAFMGFASPL